MAEEDEAVDEEAIDELKDLGKTILDDFDPLAVEFIEVEFVGEELRGRAGGVRL